MAALLLKCLIIKRSSIKIWSTFFSTETACSVLECHQGNSPWFPRRQYAFYRAGIYFGNIWDHGLRSQLELKVGRVWGWLPGTVWLETLQCLNVNLRCNVHVYFLLSLSLRAEKGTFQNTYIHVQWAYKVTCNYMCWCGEMFRAYTDYKNRKHNYIFRMMFCFV